jgi:protein TonB
MAGDAASVADMRGGAHRAFALALLASILLHALLLAALPRWRAPAEVPAPPPLTARLAEPPAPPALPAMAPVEDARPPPPAAARAPLRRPAPKPAPAAPPVQPVLSELALAPAAPLTPAAPGPVARIDPLPAAPPPADSDALETYRASVNAAATRFKRYPRAAIDNNWEGEVVVLLTIGADGRIAALRVRRSSGYEILDRQALDMFRNAKPFVPLPRELRGREFEVELRAIYSLKDQGSG